jgi:hypothetical protein
MDGVPFSSHFDIGKCHLIVHSRPFRMEIVHSEWEISIRNGTFPFRMGISINATLDSSQPSRLDSGLN